MLSPPSVDAFLVHCNWRTCLQRQRKISEKIVRCLQAMSAEVLLAVLSVSLRAVRRRMRSSQMKVYKTLTLVWIVDRNRLTMRITAEGTTYDKVVVK